MRCTLGTLLHSADQAEVLAKFVHRSTRENHKGSNPVQFADDAEWLANTVFMVKKDGRLDQRANYCTSYPTWPDCAEIPRGAPQYRGYANRFNH